MQKDSGQLVPLHYFGFATQPWLLPVGLLAMQKQRAVSGCWTLLRGLAGLGAYQLSQDPRNVWVFLATSGTLAGIMGMRFYNSGKFMPAGLIAGASLLMVAKLGISMLSSRHS